MQKLILLLLSVGLLKACASTPEFDTSKADHSLTPSTVASEKNIHYGKQIIWGGTILDTRNLKDSTQIEILAYPLNTSHRPILDEKPLGRFILVYPAYLENTIYTQGKQLTTSGQITKTRQSKIGESNYIYPIISANKIHLWENNKKSKTSFHFGIGIGI